MIRRLLLMLCIGLAAASSAAAKERFDVAGAYRDGRYQEVIAKSKGGTLTAHEALYLGLSHLRLGDPLRAIDAWNTYTRLAAGGEGAREIAPFLTILRRGEAHRRALDIRRQPNGPSADVRAGSPALDAKRIVVAPFRNLGARTADPLTKGLAALLIADLAKVPTLRVVDRIYTQAVLNELHFNAVDGVDEHSAPQIGASLGAAQVVVGSILSAEADRLVVDTVVIRTKDGRPLTAPGLSVETPTFDRVEKALLKKILCGVGQCPERLAPSVRTAVEARHTTNVKAFRLFSEGLEWLDRAQYREAARAFALAVDEDPGFEAARTALRDTPIFSADLATMVARAEMIPFDEYALYAP
ncbi:MAG: CsgG/HfaB family protein, partial [Nitrospiria bacterium]